MAVAPPRFDLDGKGTCLDDAGRSSHNLATCDGGPNAPCASSCENPIALGTGSASTLCDLANGVDNAFLQITTALRSSVNTVPVDRIVDLTSLFTSGRATLLVKVSGYSGEPDDDHVVISVFNGTGLTSGAHAWDGRTSVAWDVTSYGVRADGFVRQGVLVVPRIPLVYFPVFAAEDVPAALVSVTDVRVQAHLGQVGDAWVLTNGVFGGRIDARDLLRTAANAPSKVFAVEGGVEPSCIGTPDSLRQMRELVCQFADLAGTTPQCEALSVGFVFRTAPATLGVVQVDAPAPPGPLSRRGRLRPGRKLPAVARASEHARAARRLRQGLVSVREKSTFPWPLMKSAVRVFPSMVT